MSLIETTGSIYEFHIEGLDHLVTDSLNLFVFICNYLFYPVLRFAARLVTFVL